MAVAQLLLSMEPKYICHNQCTMDTSSPIVPKLSTEILLIPAILELYHIPPLKEWMANNALVRVELMHHQNSLRQVTHHE